MIALHEISDAELATAADDNLLVHCSWVQRQTAGMRVLDERGLVVIDSGLPCDTFNFVCHARLEPGAALPRAREALAYFAGVARPFAWWVGPADRPTDLGELLREVGLEPAETELAMAADLNALRVGDLSPDGLRIRRVATPAELRDFARVSAANWVPPDPEVIRFYGLAAPALLGGSSPLWFYVGYLDGMPVATSELTVGGGVVGLYSVCTLEGYRRRGFGTALTLAPLLEARAHGHRTAILQAASAGVGVYTQVGFSAFGQLTEYKPPLSGGGVTRPGAGGMPTGL